MSTATKLVAVEAGLSTAGAIVYSRFESVSHAALAQSWREHGLPEAWLPSPTTAETALKRAMQELADKRTLVRPLVERGHWALVAETVVDNKIVTNQIAHAWTDGQIVHIDGNCSENVLYHYENHLAKLAASDVSLWFVRVLGKLDAVTLRDRGGVYFVPAPRVDLLRQVAAVLRSVGCVVYEIPALRSDEAADAVLASLQDEAQAEMAKIEEWLREQTEEPSDRSRQARELVIARCKGKISRYEELFGRRMESMHDMLSTLRNRVTAVGFAAQVVTDGRYLPESGERGILELDDRTAKEVTALDDERPAPLLEIE